MTVVAANLYRAGQRVGPVSIDAMPECHGDDEFVWIGLYEPDESELRAIAERYGLHPLAVEDAVNAKQLPKLDIYGDQLFVVARTAHLDGDHIRYGETAIFVGKHHIVTVRHGSARAHNALRAELEASPALLARGTDYVLHAILDFVVDGYQPIIDQIEECVLEIEQSTLDSFLSREQIARLFTFRRQLIRFQRVAITMGELVGKLVNLDIPCIDRDIRPYFKDVLDHLRRTESTTGTLREVLGQVFEVSNLLEQQRQGAITRQLAAWAAILAVPTAIAGIYGMNFEYMPELKVPGAYFIVLGVIATLCGILYARFRALKWL
ncbi:magnesium and cobalt transport protein CorA [Sphingomonas sp. Y38-1Y]|uniref:magnesium and cobalt transport protein CorA n=1 Tax=Sphingomonas sp. Y38-1Y TaxID=3078265 RepID=UPI0028EA1E31|nr:magnesium and cobalt transport protein CorA [Sphingomonas sp. Y38-1Y]